MQWFVLLHIEVLNAVHAALQHIHGLKILQFRNLPPQTFNLTIYLSPQIVTHLPQLVDPPPHIFDRNVPQQAPTCSNHIARCKALWNMNHGRPGNLSFGEDLLRTSDYLGRKFILNIFSDSNSGLIISRVTVSVVFHPVVIQDLKSPSLRNCIACRTFRELRWLNSKHHALFLLPLLFQPAIHRRVVLGLERRSQSSVDFNGLSCDLAHSI